MDGNNLLSGGVDILNDIKDCLLELHGYQSKQAELHSDEEMLDKTLKATEDSMNDEVGSTIKKRRQEIEESFDGQLGTVKARIRKTKDKREKFKNSKVSERIEEETASLRSDNSRLRLEGRTILKQNHVPVICFSKLYYALYSPSDFMDLIIIISTLLITLFIIPCGIYFFLLPQEKTLYLILIYLIAGIIFFGLYILIGNKTKDKHPEIIKQVKEIRANIKVNNRRIAAIKKSILKDKDESTYGLEDFDEELQKLEKEAADIENQRKDAVLAFDNTTSKLITSEIKGQYDEKLLNLRKEYGKVIEEIGRAEDRIKALTIKIASEYEPIIGKDLMTLERLDSLINIIQAGNANTVSEALNFYRQNMNTI